MTCEDLQDRFELYSLGLLKGDPQSEAEAREVEAHLARACTTCEKNLRDALAVNALMLASVPPVTPPARLKRRILAGLGHERAGWGWLGWLAAACMLAVAVWLSVQERRRESDLAGVRREVLQLSAERDRQMEAFSFLNQPDTRQIKFGKGQTQPLGSVLVNPRLGVLLIASNLRALPAGRTYQMWVIYKGASPRPAGLFRPSAQGSAMHSLAGPVDAQMLDAVAVSVEPEAGSQAPTTKPFIVTSL